MSEQRPALNRKSTRRERRAAVRSERPPVRVQAAKRPAWRSPMAMLTGGALLVGVVVIVIALVSTGQIGSDPAQVKTPVSAMPDKALWDGRALGPADAKVTIEVFEDFQCPACGIFTQQTQPSLIRDFVADGKVRFIFKDMAFLDNGAGRVGQIKVVQVAWSNGRPTPVAGTERTLPADLGRRREAEHLHQRQRHRLVRAGIPAHGRHGDDVQKQ